MSLYQFIFYIGIISLVFGFLFKWIIALPFAVVFASLKIENGQRLIKIIDAYLSASMLSIITLVALSESLSWLKLVFYPLIAIFILLMNYVSNEHETRKEARETADYTLMEMIHRDNVFNFVMIVIAIVFYITSLFIPALAHNFVTVWLFSAIDWINNLPIIGFLIGIGGIIFVLKVAFYGLLFSGGTLFSIFSKKTNG